MQIIREKWTIESKITAWNIKRAWDEINKRCNTESRDNALSYISKWNEIIIPERHEKFHSIDTDRDRHSNTFEKGVCVCNKIISFDNKTEHIYGEKQKMTFREFEKIVYIETDAIPLE